MLSEEVFNELFTIFYPFLCLYRTFEQLIQTDDTLHIVFSQVYITIYSVFGG